MSRNLRRHTACAGLALFALLSGCANVPSNSTHAVLSSGVGEGETQGADSAVRPTSFHNLRFEEDWTWLGDGEETSDHVAPGLKHQELGDGWTLGAGGQVRYRFQSESNKSLTDTSPRRNDFHLLRTRLHADLRHESGWRVFVEALDARAHGSERPELPIDANNVDLLNGFVEHSSGDLLWRVGRMELQEGMQRLVSPLEWGNTRRTFDGALVRLIGDGSATDIFVTRPIVVDARDTDTRDSSRWFSGVYHTEKLDDGATFDLFGLVLNEKDALFASEETGTGDQDLYTIGARYAGKSDATDYELWYAKQFGDQGGDDVDAFAASARIGHTLTDTKGKPRFGLDLDYASGDDDPTDGTVETFNQLFPLGHAYFGFLDLVGRQNIIDVSPNATYSFSERTKLRGAVHWFRLAEREDALYNAGGGATFADPSGAGGTDVGREFDITLVHKPEWLGPHGNVLVGWSHFEAGDHIDRLGGDGSAELFYIQLAYTF